jgi:hypothetical protein
MHVSVVEELQREPFPMHQTTATVVGESTRQEKKDRTREIQYMTQEERNTMLVVLSSYMPYNVMVEYDYGDGVKRSTEFHGNYYYLLSTGKLQWKDFKPYLRSLSSMTEEEKKELSKKYVWNIWTGQIQIRYHSQGCWDDETECPTEEYIELFNWLNKNKFDYRGLIEKGQAIEAPKDLYRK